MKIGIIGLPSVGKSTFFQLLTGAPAVAPGGRPEARVGIARVVLKDPAILILDEATSSLDSATEADVQSALEEASRGRTTLVVAHRLSTIAGADQIVVLDAGRVVERGTHAALIARDGLYAALWKRQAEEPEAVAAAE